MICLTDPPPSHTHTHIHNTQYTIALPAYADTGVPGHSNQYNKARGSPGSVQVCRRDATGALELLAEVDVNLPMCTLAV